MARITQAQTTHSDEQLGRYGIRQDGEDFLSIVTTRSTLDHGSKGSISTSAVQITSTSIAALSGVLVKAAIGNSGTVYVGNSDVTNDTTEATDGFELEAGESIVVPIDNANKVFVIGSAAGQKVFWVVV